MIIIKFLNWFRCHPRRHYWYGEGNIRHFLRMHRCILHSVRRVILSGIHRCDPTVLHLHWVVDVYSICVAQQVCEAIVFNGSWLDWWSWWRSILVLYRLWFATDFWWYPMAGKLIQRFICFGISIWTYSYPIGLFSTSFVE